MKHFILIISALALLMPISANGAYSLQIEKALKKRYKEVNYLAHSDCYMVMSKSDKGYYGVCNAEGEELIPANYQKISFENGEDGDVVMFALNPNFKAESQGNIVYTKKRGKIMDFGRNEPQYIVGGFLTSYGKPIYNMSGNVVLDCEQTSVQPMRIGMHLKGYGVASRQIINKEARDELVICGPTFDKLFSLDGGRAIWKVNIDVLGGDEFRWKCSKSIGANDFLTLIYGEDGTLVSRSDEVEASEDSHALMASATTAQKQENIKKEEPAQKPDYNRIQKQEKKRDQSIAENVARRQVSDVDFNPPVSTEVADKTFAVIISNENYSEVEKVQFALNDGAVVSNYFEKTLGIPKTNIKYVPDATLNNMRKQISWLKQIADAFGKEAKIIFYYSGHGVPDEQSKNAYLMPVDGYHSDMTTNLSVNKLYEELSSLDVAQVTVFIDACFSGSQRGDQMLVSSRGVRLKSRSDAPKGKMIVFSAALGDETAYPFEQQKHGLFTYYLLKKLKSSGDKVTLGELSDYISTEVKRTSLLQTGKLQTPTTSVSPEIANGWKERSL